MPLSTKQITIGGIALVMAVGALASFLDTGATPSPLPEVTPDTVHPFTQTVLLTTPHERRIDTSSSPTPDQASTLGHATFIDDGYLITATHVINDHTQLRADGAAITQIWNHPSLDISLLYTDDANKAPLRLLSENIFSDQLPEKIISLILPGGYTIDGSLTSYSGDLLLADLDVQPGMSGAPIVDTRGKLVGIISARVETGVSLIVPVNEKVISGLRMLDTSQ